MKIFTVHKTVGSNKGNATHKRHLAGLFVSKERAEKWAEEQKGPKEPRYVVDEIFIPNEAVGMIMKTATKNMEENNGS